MNVVHGTPDGVGASNLGGCRGEEIRDSAKYAKWCCCMWVVKHICPVNGTC